MIFQFVAPRSARSFLISRCIVSRRGRSRSTKAIVPPWLPIMLITSLMSRGVKWLPAPIIVSLMGRVIVPGKT